MWGWLMLQQKYSKSWSLDQRLSNCFSFSWFSAVVDKMKYLKYSDINPCTPCNRLVKRGDWGRWRFVKAKEYLHKEPSGCSNLQRPTCYLTNATVLHSQGLLTEVCLSVHMCTCVSEYKENLDISTTFDLFLDKSLLWWFVCSVASALKITALSDSVFSWWIYETGWMERGTEIRRKHLKQWTWQRYF